MIPFNVVFRLLFVFVCASIVTPIKAQISGYQGKHFIFKTDMTCYALAQGYQSELELAVLRKVSTSFSYRYIDQSYALSRIANLANIQSKNVALMLKMYGNGAYTAPRGEYVYLKYARGLASVDFTQSIAGGGTNGLPPFVNYTLSSIKVRDVELGYGMQYIWLSRWCFDMGMGLNWGRMLDERSLINDTVKPVYGPNLWVLSNRLDFENGFGISAHLSVGLLLF